MAAPSRRPAKAAAVEQVVQAAIDFGAAADGVTDGAARALGINRTDMRVLAWLRNRGPAAVGRIARANGLSPAAATTVVRRLGAADYVELFADPEDGRRTVVALTPTARDRLAELYGPMLERGRERLAALTVDQMVLVETVLRQAEELQVDLAAQLGAGALRAAT